MLFVSLYYYHYYDYYHCLSLFYRALYLHQKGTTPLYAAIRSDHRLVVVLFFLRFRFRLLHERLIIAEAPLPTIAKEARLPFGSSSADAPHRVLRAAFFVRHRRRFVIVVTVHPLWTTVVIVASNNVGNVVNVAVAAIVAVVVIADSALQIVVLLTVVDLRWAVHFGGN